LDSIFTVVTFLIDKSRRKAYGISSEGFRIS
jgi:hypothetical protein